MRDGSIRPQGAWPTTFLLGVQKGMTTSLAAALRREGMHNSSRGKETHYFGFMLAVRQQSARATPEQLAQAFGYPSLFREGVDSFDADPGQLMNHALPDVLAQSMPLELHARVRLIAVLREPSDRLLSWYNMKVDRVVRDALRVPGERCGFELCNFCRRSRGLLGLGAPGEPTLVSGELRGQHGFEPSFDTDARCEVARARGDYPKVYRSFERGEYAAPITRWRGAWPRQQMLILNFEHLLAAPAAQLGAIGRFAGLPRLHLRPLPHELQGNQTHSAYRTALMCCRTLCHLASEYRASTEQLYSMLDADHAHSLVRPRDLPASAVPPASEPYFGRWRRPACRPCTASGAEIQSADAASREAEIRAQLAQCPPAQPELSPANRTRAWAEVHAKKHAFIHGRKYPASRAAGFNQSASRKPASHPKGQEHLPRTARPTDRPAGPGRPADATKAPHARPAGERSLGRIIGALALGATALLVTMSAARNRRVVDDRLSLGHSDEMADDGESVVTSDQEG